MSLDKNERGLRSNISLVTGLLMLRFEFQMSKEVISLPVKYFFNLLPSYNLLKTSNNRSL